MKALKERSIWKRAQGMTEYIIIVAIIAILSLVIVFRFGNQIRDIFWGSGSELAGEDATVENRMGNQDEQQKSSIIKDL
ncbi:MAG: hypothetical protein V1918_08240 [Planctomycetota bacterium]